MRSANQATYKDRELRRGVVLSARLRTGVAWSEARIFNISTRGLLIQTGRSLSPSDTVELWRGERVIVARVMWRRGSRAGLQVDDPLPVDDILTSGQEQMPKRATGRALVVGQKRLSDDGRSRARAIEFVGVVMLALLFTVGAFSMVEQALARPLGLVASILDKSAMTAAHRATSTRSDRSD